jgi:23S rRNA (uracil1939-C5)-methyltransferase
LTRNVARRSELAGGRNRLSVGDELTLTIDRLAYGGKGVARADGFVVFVAGGLPGDTVRARVEKSKKAYADARALEVVEPSPDRVEPVADHPGAPWQVLPYAKQLATKAEQVEDALRRIGRLDGFAMEPIVPAAREWRYRNKLEYSFGEGAGGELICGFHAPGRFDRIVAVTDNKLASERGNELREATLEVCREAGLKPWDRRTSKGFLRNLVIREGQATGQFQVRLVTTQGELPVEALRERVAADSLWWTQTEMLGETTVGGKSQLLAGAPQLEDHIGELRFLISPEAFFQTNTEMAGLLYGIAAEYADLHGTERVYDLFCGIGTIALTLAPRARAVHGLELVQDAILDAAENARLNEITNVSFYSGDVRTSLRELVDEVGRPDVVVVDPPRAGLSAKVVRRIVEAAPDRIVYVSCNPTTLAPNAAQLVEAGYTLDRVRPVDLFPQTPHIECVARFTAGADGVRNPDRP